MAIVSVDDHNSNLYQFVFPCRNYRVDLCRWTTNDPSGFPDDGFNNKAYLSRTTGTLDPGDDYRKYSAPIESQSVAFKESSFCRGCLMDLGIYCLNTSRFLLEEEPASLTATTYSSPDNPLFTEVEEEVSFLLNFPSGDQALCSASYNGDSSKRY